MDRTRGISTLDVLIALAALGIGAVLVYERSDYVQRDLRIEQGRLNMRALEWAEILYEIDHWEALVFGGDDAEDSDDEMLDDEMLDDEMLDDEMPMDDLGDEDGPELTERLLADLAPYLLDLDQVRCPTDGSAYTLLVKEFGYEISSGSAEADLYGAIDSGVYSWEEVEEVAVSNPEVLNVGSPDSTLEAGEDSMAVTEE